MAHKDISDYVVHFNDVPYERKSIERVLWGFKDLDYYTKGIEKGLTIIEADTNAGKSILTMQVLQNVSIQGYRTCVYASEHTNDSYKMLVMQQNGKKGEFELVPFKNTNGEDTNIADWYVNKRVEENVSNNLGKNIELFNSMKKDKDIETIIEWIEYCHNELDCKFCLIDNFMEIENKEADMFRGQSDAITKLRDVLLRLGMMGILVMHINKESATNGFRLTSKSSSGTSNAGNKAYNIIALYRKDCIYVGKGQEKMLTKFIQDCAKSGYDYEQCDAFAEVIKTKGNGNGVVGLLYDNETKSFSQANKISGTEADRIYKTTLKQETFRFKDMVTEIQCEELPF